MVDAINPWSRDGWSVTEQAAYFRQHGAARAEARARDAGTTLGAPRPAGGATPRAYAEVALVRPGNPPIYRFLVPQKRSSLEGNIRDTDVGDIRSVEGGAVREWTP